jgi:fucose permease
MFAGSILQATGMVIISQAVSPWQAWAGGFIVGMGSGIADAIVSPLVCAIYPERRTRMTGLAHAFYAIGVVVTVLLVLGLLNAGWPWRRAFVVLAALALPWGVISLFVRLPSQSHAGTERLPARQVVRRGAFWLLMLAIFFGGVTEIGPSSWLPTFVEKATPGSRNAGGLGLLAFGLTLAVGRLGVSAIIHRIGARRMFALGGLLCMLSLVMAALAASTGGTVFWLTALGLGVAGFWPTIVGCAGDRFPQAGASMFSLLAATGNFGGVVGPMLIGLLADGLGLRTAMALLAIAPAAVMILMVTLLRKQARSGA